LIIRRKKIKSGRQRGSEPYNRNQSEGRERGGEERGEGREVRCLLGKKVLFTRRTDR